MSKNLQLQIPVPCHEDWNKMTPDSQGRFCMSCQKSVVDFSSMSDNEILLYFKNTSSNTCGRFREEQLNRDYASPLARKKLNWYKYFLNILIPTLLMTSKSYSQGMIKKSPAVCTSSVKQAEEKRIIWGELRAAPVENSIFGKVTDEKGEPLAYATVTIKGTRRGVVTDANGNYKLSVDESFPLTISVSYVGYFSQEMIVDEKKLNSSINIVLYQAVKGEVVIVGLIIPKRKKPIFHDFKKAVIDTMKTTSSKLSQSMSTSLKMYPNPLPSSSLLTIEYPVKTFGEYRIEISDINGKLLQVEQLNVKSTLLQKQIRLKQGMLAGGYIVTLFGPEGNRISNQKLLIH